MAGKVNDWLSDTKYLTRPTEDDSLGVAGWGCLVISFGAFAGVAVTLVAWYVGRFMGAW